MFVCHTSRSIQNFYHVLLCIENSTNYKSLLLTVSFYMLSLRWDSPEASWDLRIFNSSSISCLILSYLLLISALLCKLVICMFVLSPILILERLQHWPKILTLTLCSFQYSNWMQLKNIIGLLWICHLSRPAPSILKDLNPLEFRAIALLIHISELL